MKLITREIDRQLIKFLKNLNNVGLIRYQQLSLH